jgi:hypothetical protein
MQFCAIWIGNLCKITKFMMYTLTPRDFGFQRNLQLKFSPFRSHFILQSLASKWRNFEMKISLAPEFFGRQDIHQNSCNSKYFLPAIVPFLCQNLLNRIIFRDLGIALAIARPCCSQKCFLSSFF